MVILDNLNNRELIETLVFDLDGTITRWKNVEGFLKKALIEINVPYRKESLEGLYKAMKMREIHALTTGESDEEIYSYLLSMYIEDLKKYSKTGKDLKDKMFELEASETYISPEIPKEIAELAKKYDLYIYTNWFYNQAIKKLDRYNLRYYFKKIYSSQSEYIKDCKVAFECLMLKEKLEPKRTVFIGDSECDVIPSRKAKAHSIYLDYSIKTNNDITKEKMKLITTSSAAVTEFSDIRYVLKKAM